MRMFLAKENKRYFLISFLLFAVLFLLSGCSTAAKSEKEIIKDLQTSPIFISTDVEISDYEIIKRKTDVNNKTDEIYITVHTEAAELTSSLTYELKYELYNEGWILESVMRYWDGPWEFSGLSDEQLLADIKDNDYYFSNWELNIENVEIIEESCDSNSMVYYEKQIVVSLTAHDKLFDYHATYNMYYGVVDGAWELRSTGVRSRRYAPTFSPNTAATDRIVEELTLGKGSSATQYDSFEYLRTEADWENCMEIRYYTATKDWWFGTETYLIAIPLGFSLENGEDHAMWTYHNDTIESMLQSVDWDIAGSWGSSDPQAWIYIYNISKTKDTDTFSVLLRCDAYHKIRYGDTYYCDARDVWATMRQTEPGVYLLTVDAPPEESDGIWVGDFRIRGSDSSFYGRQGIFWEYSNTRLELNRDAREVADRALACIRPFAAEHGVDTAAYDPAHPMCGIWMGEHSSGVREMFCFCPDGTLGYTFVQSEPSVGTAEYTYDGEHLTIIGNVPLFSSDALLLDWMDNSSFSIPSDPGKDFHWVCISRISP